MSWNDIDNASKPKKIIKQYGDEKFNYLVYKIFTSDDGELLLAHLKKIYSNKPVCEPEKPASFGYWREGQNSVIRDIEKWIQQHLEIVNQKG